MSKLEMDLLSRTILSIELYWENRDIQKQTWDLLLKINLKLNKKGH